MATYPRIEEKSGIGYALVKGVSFNINDKRWQYLFKDFSWRVVEEVGEALEAYFLSQITENDESRQKHFIHVIAEFIDGLHFFTELLIISGVDTAGKIGDILGAPESLLDPISLFWRENFQTTLSDLSTQCMKSIQFLGMAMNCLKQKPWKQTEMLTDEMIYKKLLVRSFWFYIGSHPATHRHRRRRHLHELPGPRCCTARRLAPWPIVHSITTSYPISQSWPGYHPPTITSCASLSSANSPSSAVTAALSGTP